MKKTIGWGMGLRIVFWVLFASVAGSFVFMMMTDIHRERTLGKSQESECFTVVLVNGDEVDQCKKVLTQDYWALCYDHRGTGYNPRVRIPATQVRIVRPCGEKP